MRNSAGHAGLVNGGDGIASADDRRRACAGCGRDGSRDFERSIRESRHLENAHGAVPNDGPGARNFRGERGGGLGADIEAHLIGRRRSDVYGGGGRVGFKFGGDDVVDGKHEPTIVLLGVRKNLARQIELVVFNERFADGQALRFEKRVGHAAANEGGVRNLQKVLDDFDLVADFCATENRDKRPRGIGQGFAEIVELFFHQQPGDGLLDVVRDADDRGVGPVRRAKGIANENAVTKRSELLRESFVVFLFFRMETNVFQQQDIAVGKRFAF